MDREEMVKLVTQMARTCGIDLAQSSLIFMPENTEGVPSVGEQLHVQAELNFGTRKCLYALLDEYKLKFKETPEKIIILVPPAKQASQP